MKKEISVLAGGCFWGVEELIREIPGVLKTDVGYCGGRTDQPVYSTVKTGQTGHAEALQVEFDSEILDFSVLLEHFFKLHDPTTKNQQGNDVGSQYRSVIFYSSDSQKEKAVDMVKRVNQSGAWKRPVVTEVVPLSQFFLAEDYHQDYLKKNPNGYTCHYYRKVEF
jgi:peptide-methionine (S)-S-oxide reductase/peptide methionine sulfoxide reductase msrA/msrB